ncbi:hypothetical protein ES703_110841 [subsurface metagenome]
MDNTLDFFKYLLDKLLIPNVTVDKFITGIILHILEVIQVSGIGELIQVDDSAFRITLQHIMDEIASDKTRTASN